DVHELVRRDLGDELALGLAVGLEAAGELGLLDLDVHLGAAFALVLGRLRARRSTRPRHGRGEREDEGGRNQLPSRTSGSHCRSFAFSGGKRKEAASRAVREGAASGPRRGKPCPERVIPPSAVIRGGRGDAPADRKRYFFGHLERIL